MSCGVGRKLGLDPELLWLWHRPAAVVLTQLLAWELPCASPMALKRKKKCYPGIQDATWAAMERERCELCLAETRGSEGVPHPWQHPRRYWTSICLVQCTCQGCRLCSHTGPSWNSCSTVYGLNFLQPQFTHQKWGS